MERIISLLFRNQLHMMQYVRPKPDEFKLFQEKIKIFEDKYRQHIMNDGKDLNINIKLYVDVLIDKFKNIKP
jgi:hypothetical protein